MDADHQMFQTGDHLFKVTSLTSGYTRMVNWKLNMQFSATSECRQKDRTSAKVCLRSRGEVDDNDRYAVKDVNCLDTMFENAVVGNPLQCCLLTLKKAPKKPFQQLDIGNLNGGPGSKRARVCNVMCINCGSNRYRKTPCQVPIH
ncbi:hypothetical protein BASA60_002765 [Batrachochytrium salamandrivorans]|nr:hypothetical protein BASA60_002765 [Batrachochytrium salamandrivorans]